MAHDNAGPGDLQSRTRPVGPLELRHLAELTGAYAMGLRDVLVVLQDAARENRIILERYVRLLDLIQSLVAVDGDLDLVAKECRRLLGEE